MSQSFTSMDARTQPFAVDSYVRHIDQDIQGRVVSSNHKDTTIYDEDCPDDEDPNGSLLTFRNYDLKPLHDRDALLAMDSEQLRAIIKNGIDVETQDFIEKELYIREQRMCVNVYPEPDGDPSY